MEGIINEKKLLFANKHSFTKEMFDSLNNLDVDVIYLDGADQQSYDMDFSDIDVVVCFKFFDFNDISKFKSLKFIHTTSTGVDQMPMDYIKEHGIILKNCPGVHSAPISEYVIEALCFKFIKALLSLKNSRNSIYGNVIGIFVSFTEKGCLY